MSSTNLSAAQWRLSLSRCGGSAKTVPSKNKTSCHSDASSLVSLSCEVRRMRTLRQKKTRISTGCGASECLMTSLILSTKRWARSVYLSLRPE